MTPKISTIIPTYNAADTIDRTLASVFAQTIPVHEIICIDDCSIDDTRARLAMLAAQHSKLRIIHADVNRGPSRARNLGIEAATGDWLAILDADDIWRPERMAHMHQVAVEEDADIVLDNIMLHDAAAGVDVRLVHTPDWSRKHLDMVGYWLNNRFGRFQYCTFQFFGKRQFFVDSGVRYLDHMRYGEDLFFMADMIAAGAHTIITAEPGYVYSARFGPISRQQNAGSRSRPDFLPIVAEIDRFCERHKGLLDDKALNAIAICRASNRTAAKANAARSRRDAGDYIGYLRGIAEPSVLAQILVMRWRSFRKRARLP